jgi:hypothetical protein
MFLYFRFWPSLIARFAIKGAADPAPLLPDEAY